MFSVHLYQYMLIYQGYLEKQNKAIIGAGVAMEGIARWGMAMGGRGDGNGREGEEWFRLSYLKISLYEFEFDRIKII